MLEPHHGPPHPRWRNHLPRFSAPLQDGALAVAWSNRWVGGAAAAAAGALAALALSLAMPRGPITTGDALMTMILGLLIGLLAGFAMRSRWAMLLVTVAFVTVCELAWLGESGPTASG